MRTRVFTETIKYIYIYIYIFTNNTPIFNIYLELWIKAETGLNIS